MVVKKGVKRISLKSPHTKKQEAVLKVMERAAKQAGLRVSSGRLRFAGLKLKSGSCLLRGQKWLILDKAQPFDDLVDVYREAFVDCDLYNSDLPPADLETLAPYLPAVSFSGVVEANCPPA